MAKADAAAKKLADEVERSKKIMEDVVKLYKEMGVEAGNVEKEVKQIQKEFGQTKEDAEKLLKATAENVKNLKKQGGATEDISEGTGKIGNLWKSSGKNLRSNIESAKDYSDKIKGMQNFAKAHGQSLGAAGKALGALGLAAGILAKAMGPIFAVKQVIDFAVKIDSFIKKMNKQFATVRGPQIMTADVTGQFKDFNDQVFNIGANIRDGLRPQEVEEFIQAIAQAGVNLNQLNNGIYDYRDAVHIAAKASRILGTDTVRTAYMMSDQMLNLRMSLEQVDDSFVEMAFDAEKAGINADKFWAAVQNSVTGLAFYGKAVNEMSTAMRVLSESQVTGIDGVSAAVQEMGQAFQKSSTQTNMAFIELAGGAQKMSGIFGKVKKGVKEEVEKLQVKIEHEEGKGDKADVAELEKLRNEMGAAQGRQERLEKAMHGDLVAQGQELAMATQESPGLIMDLIKNIAGVANVTQLQSGEQLECILQSIEGVTKGALSKTTTRTMIEAAKQQARTLEYAVKKLGILNKITVKGTKSQVKELKGLSEQTDQDTLNGISARLAKTLNIDKNSAQQLVKLGSVNKKAAEILGELAAGNLDPATAMKKLEEITKATDIANTLFQKDLSKKAKDSKGVQSAADKTFDKIVDNTLSMDDLKNITDSGLKWQALSAAGLQSLDANFTAFVREFFHRKPSKEQKAALEKLPKEMQKEVENFGATEVVVQVQGRKKELEAKEQADNSMLAIWEGFGGDLTKALGKKYELGAKQEGGETLTAGEKGTLAVLQDVPDNIDPKDFKDFAQKQKNKINKDKMDTTKQITTADYQLKNLETIDKSSMKSAELLAASVAGNKDAASAYFEQKMSTMGEEGLNVSDLDGAMDRQVMLQAAEDKKQFKASAGRGVWITKEAPRAGEGMSQAEAQNSVGKPSAVRLEQGLQKPITVTHAGPVVLHPKEMVLPANMGNFQTKPMMMGAGAAPAAAGGVGGGKNISISVTATEKDLAQRIANEVRSILYKEQVNNLG